jgi:Acyl-CoA thioesterase N-terminal domain/Acyl-CoA thioesterase C-terminal domain
MTGAATSLFEPDGPDRWVPTELARGPWDPRACHGGPVSALLTRLIERTVGDTPVEWQIARLTIELTRPVPVGRSLSVQTEIERDGRKVSLVAARLLDGDTEVARARSLRIRTKELDLSDEAVQPLPDPPGTPAEGMVQRVVWAVDEHVAFHKDACEHRFTESGWDTPGPVGVWIKLLVPVVPDEEPSGAQRAAAAADFGNGVSGGLPFERYTYINPDLTVHLMRTPVGEWIGMRTASYYGTGTRSSGAGFAESALYDADGRLGRSVQSLILDER